MTKCVVSLFLLFSLLSSGMLVTGAVWVHAQTYTETSVIINVKPNPATLNQRIDITVQIQPAPPTPNDIFQNVTITLTLPDGKILPTYSYNTNQEGSLDNFFYYTFSSYGNATLKVAFPGQAFANDTIYYLQSENQTIFTVTEPLPSPGSNVGTWKTKTQMNIARGSLGVATVDGKIYAIGGYTEGGKWPDTEGIVAINEQYDPTTDTWTFKAPLPTPRADFAITVFQNKLYCIGGKTINGTTAVNEVYDPATNTWTTKASMPTDRYDLQANVAAGKIFLIGGYPYGNLNQVYDPATDSWTTKAAMPTDAYSYASVVVDNLIYVVGGGSELPTVWSNLNQIYDAETDAWSEGTSAASSVYLGAAGATTGVMAAKRIYVMGVAAYNGLGAPPALNQIYDPQNGRWTAGAQVPTSRLNFGIAVVNDTIHVIGGFLHDVLGFTTPSSANEQYTPEWCGILQTSSPPPTSTTTPSPSPSPTLSPTPLPSSSSPTQQSTQSPKLQSKNFHMEPSYLVAAIATVGITAAIALVLKRRK